MKGMKTTAQVLVDCLEAEGVDVMFGIPGEETLDLMFAIRDSKIRFIPVRHEQGAAFMADVYGRLTGRAGVCLSTLGPGATNLVTGVADAYLAGDLQPINGGVPLFVEDKDALLIISKDLFETYSNTLAGRVILVDGNDYLIFSNDFY